MNAADLLRIVDAIHRDKNIPKETVFEGIEAALVTAAKKRFGEEEDIIIHINRQDRFCHAGSYVGAGNNSRQPGANGHSS